MIASSISSPPTRSDWETTMPPREMTATSVVPPPTSTIMLPVGSLTGRPAPAGGAAAAAGAHRLLDGGRFGGPCRERGFLDGALLDACNAGRDADDDSRM